MEIQDGRGLHLAKISEKNRQIILKYFKENPGKTMKDCANATGLCYQTIRNHVKEIRSE